MTRLTLIGLAPMLALLAACEAKEGMLPDVDPAEAEETLRNIDDVLNERIAEASAPIRSPERGKNNVAEPKEPVLCWQDYCPCEPPQSGPDRMVCRDLKAGLPVDPEMLSLAAGMRDARQQIDDFNDN